MKQIILNRVLGIMILSAPLIVNAQKEEKEKIKDNKNTQQITITRSGNKDDKTVIEINGDKVKINGKDADDIKDVHVSIHDLKGNVRYKVNGMPRTFNFNYNDDGAMSLLSEDANRAMLGVATEENEKGAQVESITKESAAEKAGLKKGDIITRIDGKKVESTDDVTEIVHSHKPGDKVKVNYLREGKEQEVTATLGKWKGIQMNAVTFPRMEMLNNMHDLSGMGKQWNEGFNAPNNFIISGNHPRLGLSIQDTDDGNGVKVLDVDEESNAAKAGILKDDIIVGINDKPVKGTEDVTREMRENREKISYSFKVLRNGKTQTIEVKYPRKLKTAEL